MTRRIEITVSDETWARLNAARGHEPRASFVKRALEVALAPVALSRKSEGVWTQAEVVESLESLGPNPSAAVLKASGAFTKARDAELAGYDQQSAAMERQRAMNKAKGL